MNPSIEVLDERVLILAPADKDGVLAAEVLRGAGLCTRVCKDLIEIGVELPCGAGALVLAEEALLPGEVPALVDSLGRQLP